MFLCEWKTSWVEKNGEVSCKQNTWFHPSQQHDLKDGVMGVQQQFPPLPLNTEVCLYYEYDGWSKGFVRKQREKYIFPSTSSIAKPVAKL